MMTARDDVLARIRRALVDVPGSRLPETQVPRHLPRGGQPPVGSPEAVSLFAERMADYQASVRVVDAEAATSAIAEALAVRRIGTVVVPAGLPDEWDDGLAAVHVLRDDPWLEHRDLEAVDGVVTCAAIAIATTGTIVLDGGPGQGRRALTLLPDYHLCVLRSDQVVGSVAEAVAGLDPARPLTFVSGPSATSDIEMERIEGVHGPRTLDVLVIG